ncbi:hypothetical protein IFO69_15340 [Echinicola sp. CAU 1574]|uniref:CBU-0592-like domain-containing protein n=1 Tax=Echinicola arenosa TaxID=2774144 RepID=A0ABR9AR75_9BACT|nr:hypothetical protein [Echinicola arenosa]MBD8490129.1 hypothetical protein [Echinicola arenosa]
MIFEVIGWLGAILFTVSYFLLVRGVLRQEGALYHVLNFGGAVCLMVNAIHFKDNANLAVNGVWAAIALMALYKCCSSFLRNKS